MENHDNPSFDRIDYWTTQFKKTLNEHVELQTETDPDIDPEMVRESYIINKLAVLTVANEILGERIRELEAKFEAFNAD